MRTWFITKKQILWWVSICLTVGIYWGTAQKDYIPAMTGSLAKIISGKIIVIDAGHGGIDPGAVSAQGILEKEITLQIARELEFLFQKAAVYVVMVRQSDSDLADSSEQNLLKRKRQDLKQRVFVAEQAEADLYISIHANYFPAPRWSGAQTFYLEDCPEGQKLAESIQTELVRHLGPNNRVAQTGNFRVLRDTSMPATLVEVGFLSNPQEAQKLSEVSYQKKIASAIFDGVLLYYSSEE
ncbi:MAG: N-acetylmuramoyl-L-alanine amidase CwlD [Bacillota bacterium]|nr:N-acetylmuramoyl-L-alanine amidase CwlD [Bacillota bacterium]HHU62200.1 N-acetylmuramoyl-L-alanine amidase CwlD [Natronincola sp.]